MALRNEVTKGMMGLDGEFALLKMVRAHLLR